MRSAQRGLGADAFLLRRRFDVGARSGRSSKVPGSRKLMVTLDAATLRATPARKAVRPARAPDDRSSPAIGIFTDPEVILTMRPNFLATIGSIAFWISSTATTMLATTPSSIFCRSSSRKSRNGGPALLLTRISGSGQAANRAFWPSGEATSAATGIILAPVAWRSSAAVAARRSRSRPLITTSQPACASALAQARPSPRLEAQTIALRPAIPRSMPKLPEYFYYLPRFTATSPPAASRTESTRHCRRCAGRKSCRGRRAG